MSNTRINLDYAASTPLLPEVQAAIVAALAEAGNPSAVSQAGQRAKQRVEQARRHVAALINAKPEEIYFTSCGTESNNWALRGLFAANKRKALLAEKNGDGSPVSGAGKAENRPLVPHLIISTIEHPSISLTAKRLELEGARMTILPVDREGFVSLSDLKAAMTPQTILVSLMLANGEVGTVQPVRELAAIAHEHGVIFHTDAIAAAGQIPIDVHELGVDALSMSANQFGGPQGAAALFVRENVRILPLLEGGGQEHGGRSGTESVAAIAGMGMAAEITKGELPNRLSHMARLRDHLKEGLSSRVEHVRFYGSWASRLPNNLHACIDGLSSESLVLGLDQAGVTVGLGSACNSKSMRPSAVLKAMGLNDEQAKGALVFTLSAQTTEQEVDQALEIIPTVVEKLRRVTALTARV